MSEKIRTIRLYGKLGAKFGRVHRLAVDSASEAVRALSVILPGFMKELANSKECGITYAVFSGKNNLEVEQLTHPVGNDDIRIAPILQGSKRGGLFQTILGVALIALAVWNPTSLGMTSQMAFGMGMAGATMALGGIVQMLSPQSRGLSTKDSPENGASYNFNGPVNTSAQGNPVPVLYGRMIVGSAVISAGIYAEDQA
ncbi:tail assembly protein [Cupriavidus metallidurans]|uniref:tail assembly protein n=1 Tax=Cupriavidus metallidurans TaxID=119219 RepID=UPI001648754C|nr:tail assembly protein [Cupriavidus metallidurans]